DARKNSYIFGRLCAKRALVQCTNQVTQLDHLCITNGVFGQPVVSQNPYPSAMGVSISHSHHVVAAIAFSQSHPMALDVEVVDPTHTHTIWTQLTPHERQLLQVTNQTNALGCTLLWSAWESLAKGLQAGLSITHTPYEVKQLEVTNGITRVHFRHFSHVVAICFLLNSDTLAQNPLLTMNVQAMDKPSRCSHKRKLPCWLSVLVPKQNDNSHFLSALHTACQQTKELFNAVD
ncbi:MAG: hypothetical protein AAF320_02115, partial [Myxococcota bacterium]